MAALIAVFTTVATREDAASIARALLQARLAACVQVEAIESHYRWDGELQCDAEYRLTCKTLAARWPAVEAAIRERHPYALPQITACSLDPVHAPYARWVEAECGDAGSSA